VLVYKYLKYLKKQTRDKIGAFFIISLAFAPLIQVSNLLLSGLESE